MVSIEKVMAAAAAGAISLLAVMLLVKPLFEFFSELARSVAMPASLIVALILLAVASSIFQRLIRR